MCVWRNGRFPAVLGLNHSSPHMCTSNTNTCTGFFFLFFFQITPKLQDRDQFNVSLRQSLPSSPSLPPTSLFLYRVIEYTHLCTRTQEMRGAWAAARTHTRQLTHTHLLLSGGLSSLLRSVCFWLGFNGPCLPRPKISIIGTVGRLRPSLSLW